MPTTTGLAVLKFIGYKHSPLIEIYRSTLILASVHVILLVGLTAVISHWALDFSEIFLNLCMVHLKFYSNKFLIWKSLILKKKLFFLNFLK